jgi:capsular polysaccharide biosynthesis protein
VVKNLFYKLVPAGMRREVKRRLRGQPRICPQVYAWAKQNPQHVEIVREFWGPHRRNRNAPKPFANQETPQVFLDYLEYPVYEKTLFCIRRAKIRGSDGLIFLPDGSVSHQTAWALEQIESCLAYQKKWRGPEVFKQGNYSTLILYWGLGYYHWFNDVLSTLHGTLELMPTDTVFLMPQGFKNAYGGDFYMKSLNALGIGPERVREFDGSESWILENLWWQPPAVHPDDQSPGALRWIGQRISESIPVLESETPQRIYVSRRKPSARVISNEQEFVAELERMGFRICLLEEMPFEDQVRLFRNAELVVAPHGAGLTNLIFSKPGTRVVEIHARRHERRCYWTLCEELGHGYRFYLGEPEFPGRRGEPDTRVDITKLVQNNSIQLDNLPKKGQ